METMIETPQDTLRKIYGNSVEIRTTRSVTGGDINEADLAMTELFVEAESWRTLLLPC